MMRGTVRDAVHQAGDGLRVLALVLLRLAATHLPRAWAMGLADAAGYLFYIVPLGARARRSMRRAFPSGDANVLALEWLRRPFRDYVAAVQIVSGRDVPAGWDVEQRNAPAALYDPNQSLIIATGHFSRQSMSGLYLPRVIAKALITVMAFVDRKPANAHNMRVLQLMNAFKAGIRRVREGDVEIAEVGASPGLVLHLLKHLKRPGGALIIASDGPWSKDKAGGFDRAFAGHAERHVALGTAWLSRMSQRPIVPCVSFLDTDERRIIIDWGELIPPAAKDDVNADVRVTNAVLDALERAIGQHPGQYVLPIGEERRWSETAQCWVAPTDAHDLARVTRAAPNANAEAG
ncbi:MAG: hypothetical protein AB7T59_19880 [Hyphomonadaceae bacterium]